MKTTEQLVRECFCYLCRQPIHSCISKCQLQNKLARAARRFVKAEQREMSVDKLDDEIQRLMRLANSTVTSNASTPTSMRTFNRYLRIANKGDKNE